MSNNQLPRVPYLIRTLSNLHAGAGDRSFGLIDKHVQRDPTTGLPTVFSSSIKGALREVVEYQDASEARTIFGSDNGRGKAAVLQQGNIATNDARLLSLPIRSSHELYFPATTVELLDEFLEILKGLPGDSDHRTHRMNELQQLLEELKKLENAAAPAKPIVLGTKEKEVYLEHLPTTSLDISTAGLKWLFDGRLAVLDATDFADFARDLPTVARNSLNNGISENLWYEEIVPRETVFYTTLSAYGLPQQGRDALEKLTSKISAQDGRIQLGANATVGYGQTAWTNLDLEITTP